MFARAVLSNRQKMNRCSFQEVLRENLVFVLTQENTFSQRFHFSANRKSIDFSKDGSETNFLKNEKLYFFRTLEYGFLVESTKVCLNMLLWISNFIIKSIIGKFIMLSNMMKEENKSFANISILFLRSYSKNMILGKRLK